MAKINIPASRINPQVDPALGKFFDVKSIDAGTRPASSRGDSGMAPTVSDVEDDDIVSVEYANGIRLWMRADDYAKGDDFLQGKAARGRLADWLKKTVHVMRLKPLEAAAELTGELGALAAIRHFEKQLRPAPGLYRVGDVFTQVDQILKPSDVSGPDRLLLFLHGTASGTAGSFSGLALASGQTELSIVRTSSAEWRRLQEFYGKRILAFEHRTLSQSPVENALELAALLPDHARLSLVSHSRGGLVGELLCLNQKLSKDDLKAFLDRGREEEAEQLIELSKIVTGKKLSVERFVRVACPARGTILASERLDLYLSVILNLASLIPGFGANPFFEFFKAASMEMIKSRTEAEKVPGVEAMMPESPLIHLLNLRRLSTAADLAVIAGDQQGDDVLGRLRDLVTHLYYWEDHDLIVNTDSMYRGVGRQGKAYYFFDRGPSVNHFQYFMNQKTRELLTGWLTLDDGKLGNSGFKVLTEANLALEKSSGRAAAPDAPVVVFVPAFMGTHLGGVWLDFDELALGGLSRLTAAAEPGKLLGPPYEAVIGYLQNSYNVVQFPYNWTRSAADNGELLGGVLENEFASHQRPVHVVSHSSGSLIVRAVAQNTWSQLESRGGRWIQMGGMTDGTHWAVAMIAGEALLARQLQLMNHARQQDVLKTFASWQGLLDMLPAEFLNPDAWASFRLRPDTAALQTSQGARGKQADRKSLYIAGRPSPTPTVAAKDGQTGYDLPGDGRVLESSRPNDQVWYADACHGELARHAPSFPGIRDLLERGHTDQLRRRPSAGSGADPSEGRLLFPHESDLINAAMGSGGTTLLSADIATVTVSVLHGDVSKAAYPVVVGHYQSDTIVSAERRLDELLDHTLSRRFLMAIYPGPLGTSDIVRLPNARHPGAIVVGLGEVGSLTDDKLRATVMQAILRYAVAMAEAPAAADGAWKSAAFSAVLIGTYGGETIDVQSSVTAIILAAVEANRALRRQKLWDRVRIDAVEFVDIYEDLATQAIHAVNRITERLRLNLNNDERIEPLPYLRAAEGHRDKRPVDQYSAGWWRRIAVESKKHADSEFTLRFNVLTDKARTEESTSVAQTRRVGSFVKKLIRWPDFDGRTAVTLFELLVPKRIKQESNDLANLILEVDEYSAQFPWELMSRRSGSSVLPLATRVGFIRQFRTANFESPRVARENTALVAGFPNVEGFPVLTGAATEAKEVHQQLSMAGYAVNPKEPVASGPDEAIATLYTGDCRILHLAGHGVVDRNGRTGIVLGGGDIFTANDVRNLPSTPDLVFLNCCHIGRIDPQVNKLAASLSEAFIQIGCRAVVAAGWAVNDIAAVNFAREFYNQMLAGETFGRAVLEARKFVLREHPDTNTWGAYQCYGNPEYRLKLGDDMAAAGETRRARTRTEFMEACRNVVQDGADAKVGLEALNRLHDELPQEWRDGQVLCTFGDAFGHFGDVERAIELYRQAITKGGSEAPIYAVKSFANLLDRHAKTLNQKAAAATESDERNALAARADKQVTEAIERLEWLQGLGHAVDLWCMLGGAYRRKSLFRDRSENLRKALECYAEGHALALFERGEINSYPALNWVTLRYLTGEASAAIENDLDEIVRAIAGQAAVRNAFWTQIGVPDSWVVAGTIRGNLEAEKDRIIEGYRSVLSDLRDRTRLDSVYGGLTDMRDLLADERGKAVLSEIAVAVLEIRKTLDSTQSGGRHDRT